MLPTFCQLETSSRNSKCCCVSYLVSFRMFHSSKYSHTHESQMRQARKTYNRVCLSSRTSASVHVFPMLPIILFTHDGISRPAQHLLWRILCPPGTYNFPSQSFTNANLSTDASPNAAAPDTHARQLEVGLCRNIPSPKQRNTTLKLFALSQLTGVRFGFLSVSVP